MTEPLNERPRIFVMVTLIAVVGVLSLLQGWYWLSPIIRLRNIEIPAFYIRPIVISMAVGAVLLIDAYLVARRKKRGLQLGLAVLIVYLGDTLYRVVVGSALEPQDVLAIAAAAAALYLVYRHLTHDPERASFI